MKVKDMDKTEAWSGGALLPPGRHYVRIDSAKESETSNGNPQIEMEFISEADNGTIRDWLVVVPATYGKVRSLLDAVQIEPGEGDWDLPVSQLVGRKLWILVGEEPDYNDPTKMRRRVQAYEGMSASDVPADTRDLPGAPVADGDKLPF